MALGEGMGMGVTRGLVPYGEQKIIDLYTF